MLSSALLVCLGSVAICAAGKATEMPTESKALQERFWSDWELIGRAVQAKRPEQIGQASENLGVCLAKTRGFRIGLLCVALMPDQAEARRASWCGETREAPQHIVLGQVTNTTNSMRCFGSFLLSLF